MFDKSQRSTFKYWFAHWCAFQMTALNLGCWKWRFLLHDWEKPWLKLILPYDKVKRIHIRFSHHHTASPRKKDWLAMVIDWECSRFTKSASPMNAYEYLMKVRPQHKEYILPILKELGLIPKDCHEN